MNRCEKHCGKDANCVYDVCPFEHEYTYEGEVVSGYKYICDPIEDRLINTAVEFKKNHDCNGCRMRKSMEQSGRWNCDHVCEMEVGDIIEYMRSYYGIR